MGSHAVVIIHSFTHLDQPLVLLHLLLLRSPSLHRRSVTITPTKQPPPAHSPSVPITGERCPLGQEAAAEAAVGAAVVVGEDEAQGTGLFGFCFVVVLGVCFVGVGLFLVECV